MQNIHKQLTLLTYTVHSKRLNYFGLYYIMCRLLKLKVPTINIILLRLYDSYNGAVQWRMNDS